MIPLLSRTILLLLALNSCLLVLLVQATIDYEVPFRTVGEILQDEEGRSESTNRKTDTKDTKDSDEKKNKTKKSKKKSTPTAFPSSAPETTISRCGFVEQPSHYMETLHSQMMDILKEKKRDNSYPEGGVIRVYFHIIKNDAGDGHITESQIVQQMAVLNAAFSAGAWSFILVDVDYIVNNDWYQRLQESSVEAEAKRALRRGTGEDLNIYSAYLPSYLGWAYLPNFYGSTYGYLDGVVIHTGSFPGGYLTNYDLGNTGTVLSLHCTSLSAALHCTVPG
jgi:hypothetical protein